jgi:hypothetical protein
MPKMNTGTTELRRRADELAWRRFWLTSVMIDTDRPVLGKTARPEMRIRKNSLSRRLHRLRRMKATLGPPQ